VNCLIDCGTHYFQGLNKLNSIYHFDDNWIIYSFEANPQTFAESLKYKPQLNNLFHINKAVSTKNGISTINCDINCGQGSNILENPPRKDILYGNSFSYSSSSIETIDLCNFIDQIDADRLILKLDIEGEEFNILPKIIETNVYKKINILYIEFHERFFIDKIDKMIEQKNYYINFLQKKDIKTILWN
jgi:FkbM family methyltransferase